MVIKNASFTILSAVDSPRRSVDGRSVGFQACNVDAIIVYIAKRHILLAVAVAEVLGVARFTVWVVFTVEQRILESELTVDALCLQHLCGGADIGVRIDNVKKHRHLAIF